MVNEALAQFCTRCGQALVQKAADQRANHTPTALPLSSRRPRFTDERKHVTILFADLKSSLELLADRDPEDARILLVDVIDRLIRAIGEFGGIVYQVMGDGVMAMFGAPLAYEDHALRACLAALRIQEMMKSHEQEAKYATPPQLQVRVGINSGSVLVAERGAGFNFQYTAFGETAHVAARLEQLAKPGGILLSASTYKLVKHNVQVDGGQLIPIKGLTHPIEVFELHAVRAGRRITALRSDLSPFIGRENERARMVTSLRQSADGRGRIVALVGEPGAGKSRLIKEFLAEDVGGEWLRIEMETASYTRETPYFAMLSALRPYFGINSDESPQNKRAKIVAKLKALGIDLGFASVVLLGLFGLSHPDWEVMSAERRRRGIIDAVGNIIIRETSRQPVLLIVEDLQWIDEDTEVFLRRFVAAIRTSHVLLLVNYRPEYQHDWVNLDYYSQVTVESLDEVQTAKLLNAILGVDSTLDQLKPMLRERTGGNPFFIEESVRTLEEERVLVGAPGEFRLGRAVPELAIPLTVQDLLAMRVDRLSIDDKYVLQAAAVIGNEVDHAILRGLVDYSQELLEARLMNLNFTGFLYEASEFPNRRYVFNHALTHDVVYETLPHEARRQLHSKVLERIEVLYGKRVEDFVEVIAHHAVRGEKWERAIAYLKMAGEKALSRSACVAAVGFFQDGLEALKHFPAGRAKDEYAHDLRVALRHALMPLGRHTEILPHLNEAEHLARGLGDQHRLGQTLAHLCHCHWLMGEWPQAVTHGQQALEVASALGDLPIQIWTRFFVGLAFFSLGEFSEAVDLLALNAEALQGKTARERFGGVSLPAVVSRGWLSWCLAEMGDFGLALAHASEAKALSDEAGQPFDRIQAGLAVGGISLIMGDFERAIPPLEIALSLCDSASIPILLPRVASALAYAYAMAGRLEEALPIAQRAADEVRTMRLAAMRSMCLRWVSEVLLLDNRTADALQNAESILTYCQGTGERGMEGWTLHLLGSVHLRRGSPARAAIYFRDALDIAETLGMRPLAAHCYLSQAGVCLHQGDQAKARENFLLASTLFRDLNMTFWQRRAELMASQQFAGIAETLRTHPL